MRSHFSYVWLCDPTDCSPPGSSIHGILQARILEQAAMPSSRGSSRPRDQTWSPVSPAFAGGFFTTSATWESPNITVGITGKHKGNEFPPGHTVVSGYARTGCRQCGCLLGKTGNPGASSCPSSDRQQHSLSGQGAPDGDKSALGQRERGGWGRGGRGPGKRGEGKHSWFYWKEAPKTQVNATENDGRCLESLWAVRQALEAKRHLLDQEKWLRSSSWALTTERTTIMISCFVGLLLIFLIN